MIPVPLILIRLGAGITGLALLASMWASPDRIASFPWFIITAVGVLLTLVLTGRWRKSIARRIRPSHMAAFFVVAAVIALSAALLTSRWPSYKLSWLNTIYAFLPSIRSLPFWWTQEGLQPNQTGGMLAVCTAMTASMALIPWQSHPTRATPGTSPPERDASPVWRWAAAFLSVFGVIVVFMTGSRAALAGLALAILLVLVVRTSRWLWVWGVGIGLSAVGLYASGQLAAIFHFFVHDETLDTKLVARLDIWSSALKGIQDHLLTGIGLGVFNDVMPVRYPYQTVGLSYPVSQAHNLFLDIALSIGVPGALGLVLLLIGTILLAIKGLRSQLTSRVLYLGILASIVAFLAFGITDQISFSIPTSFIIWLWAGSAVLLQDRSQTEGQNGA